MKILFTNLPILLFLIKILLINVKIILKNTVLKEDILNKFIEKINKNSFKENR